MSEKIAEIINKLPDPDERGFMSVIDKNVVDGATEAILQAAPESLIEVIDMLKEPGEGDDYKPHYALHCVVIAVGKGKEQQRKMVANTVASCLAKNYPAGVKKYLIGELQLVGGKEVVTLLQKCSVDKDLAEPARQALAAIKATG